MNGMMTGQIFTDRPNPVYVVFAIHWYVLLLLQLILVFTRIAGTANTVPDADCSYACLDSSYSVYLSLSLYTVKLSAYPRIFCGEFVAEISPKNISEYIRIFLQCMSVRLLHG